MSSTKVMTPSELKSHPEFNELISFMASNWIEGSLERLRDSERMQVLTMMMKAGIRSKRLLGATTQLILDGRIDNLETVTTVLNVMARTRYGPVVEDREEVDTKFLDKVS
jgi:hypothetical protein